MTDSDTPAEKASEKDAQASEDETVPADGPVPPTDDTQNDTQVDAQADTKVDAQNNTQVDAPKDTQEDAPEDARKDTEVDTRMSGDWVPL